ncbi:MAG: universal stress protein [Halomonadaceae bacterium]|nr:MAG: universal stress protein [Halomonadaceae bacterium]
MTTTIQRLVTATDFSEAGNNAALRGAYLAKAMGVETFCLWHVLEPAVGRVLRETLALSLSHKKDFHDPVSEALAAMAKRIEEETGITPHTEFLEGAMTQVLPQALKKGDLLVIGATGSHRFRRIMLGTTALRILQRCQVPVLVTRETAASSYQKVLVATDFSPFCERAIELAEKVAPDADIRLFHAYHASHEMDLIFAGLSDQVIQQYRDKAKIEAEQKMQRLRASHPSFNADLLPGYPVPTLIEHLETQQSDLVVVGKQGQGATEDSQLGRVTQRLLNEGTTDVLVVN